MKHSLPSLSHIRQSESKFSCITIKRSYSLSLVWETLYFTIVIRPCRVSYIRVQCTHAILCAVARITYTQQSSESRLKDMRMERKLQNILIIFSCVAALQWNEQYFNANDTAMKCALMIVFFQKLHRKILDFCIFYLFILFIFK